MEQIQEQLITFFDQMMNQIDKFNRHTYNDVFLSAFKTYEAFLVKLSELCEETAKEDRNKLIDDIAAVLPDHVKHQMGKLTKREKNKIEMNYNMNMAAYIIPAFTYSNDFYLEKIAKRMVELWNEKKVTSLTLGYSTYEDIVKGFKWRLCYITTAVCNHQNKPDDCYELTTFRKYRDEYLMNTQVGRELVEEYYDIAPGIVMMIDMQKNADQIYLNIYHEYLLPCIHFIEHGQNDKCQELYTQMVRKMQNQYLYS